MGLITNPVEKDFLKKLLLKSTVHYNPSNARKYYISCIEKAGYIKEPVEYSPELPSEPVDEYSEYYKQMIDNFEEQEKQICEICENEIEPGEICNFCAKYSADRPIGFTESQQMTQTNINQVNFNRTFIGPVDDVILNTNNRLSEINTWINMSKEEVELKKINDIISSALNNLQLSDQDNIRKMAINMFWNITNYYKTNVLKLKSNKGDLRTGYIILVIEYSIQYFRKTKDINSIVKAVEGASLSMIPEARKNIKKIFSESKNYSFILVEPESTLINSLCNLENRFPSEITSKIKQTKIDLINNKIFNNPLNNVELASCIYYITSIPINKGGIYPERLTFTIDSVKTKITQDFLNKYCGTMTLALLTNNTKLIIDFYNKNPLLKQRLISIR
jgi:hypothetical protein